MREFLFVGTYTDPILFGTGEILESRGKGIYIIELGKDGKFRLLDTVTGVRNPSFLCLSADRKYLYAVNELKSNDGTGGGFVSAFAVEEKDGRPALRFLNMQSTRGGDPCHVAVDDAGGHVFVSNYMSGSVCVFPVCADGSLGESCDFVQFTGGSVHPRRQTSPHAHSLIFDPARKRAFVPDLGTDRLMAYDIDFPAGRLCPAPEPFLKVAPGNGPRFMEFHPNGKRAYLINELSSGISLLDYDGRAGTFVRRDVFSTLPAGFAGENICADLHLTPDGSLLYASNRGHDSIACFRVDPADGGLEQLGFVPCGGKTPRNFCVSASGDFLIVANQDTDNILSFRINAADGGLEKVDEITIHTPVCVRTALFA